MRAGNRASKRHPAALLVSPLTCFHLYEGDSVEAVAEATERTQVPASEAGSLEAKEDEDEN